MISKIAASDIIALKECFLELQRRSTLWRKNGPLGICANSNWPLSSLGLSGLWGENLRKGAKSCAPIMVTRVTAGLSLGKSNSVTWSNPARQLSSLVHYWSLVVTGQGSGEPVHRFHPLIFIFGKWESDEYSLFILFSQFSNNCLFNIYFNFQPSTNQINLYKEGDHQCPLHQDITITLLSSHPFQSLWAMVSVNHPMPLTRTLYKITKCPSSFMNKKTLLLTLMWPPLHLHS